MGSIVVAPGLQSTGSIVTAPGLQSTGSVVVAPGLQSTGSIAVAPGLQSTGSVVMAPVAHRFSCSAACGIFLDQILNLCFLHWPMHSTI